MISSLHIVSLLFLLCGTVLSRPATRKITVNDHVWQVPDEPGWKEVIKEIIALQHRLQHCATPSHCREITNELRAILQRHPVSKAHFELNTNEDYDDNEPLRVFKWG